MSDLIAMVSAKTRAAEGFYNGLKFSVIHSLVYSPFYAKMEALETGTPVWRVYVAKVGRAAFFYPFVIGSVFGLKHVVAENKDRLRFDL